ncbi:alternate-type signal peptide domain-containing protein [Mycetocola saprophilus]|uniref:alternate-type signal peptide domain-containing protein n=1 Tax=Mycetocola saprophilus TaxID=76636 RepID=UPI003BF08C18
MKKTTTAAIAATLGAALLLGGAGTLAYWTDTKDAQAQTINSGSLELGQIGSANWSVQHVVGNTKTQPTQVDPSSFRIVPGDVLTTTVNVPVTLTGNDIKASLKVDQLRWEASSLRDKLSVSVVSIKGQTPVDGAVTLTSTNGQSTVNVPVVIAVTYKWDGETPVAANRGEISNSATLQAKYTLTQVAAGQ